VSGPFVETLVGSARTHARGFFQVPAVRQLVEEHRAGRAEHGDRLWLLANLEIWHRIFVDGEDVDSITRSAGAKCVSSG
jgi:asparagine synthase (glutamine-hydrolysing)